MPPSSTLVSFPAIECLIPHRPPMRLVDEVLDYDAAAQNIRCRGVVRAASPFAEGGLVPAVTALEYMAQTVAAYVTLRRLREGSDESAEVTPRVGFIVRAREFSLKVQQFSVGDVLTMQAHMTWHDAATASFDCAVEHQSAQVASVKLLVFEPTEPV